MQKNKYVYSDCNFQFVAERRHIIQNVKYFGYVFKDFLILASKAQDQDPKYVIPLTLLTSIGWSIERRDGLILRSFTIKYIDKFKEFHSNDQTLKSLKQSLSNKVTYYRIADFYEAQYNLGKGSSAKVIQIKDVNGQQKYAAKAIDKQYLNRSEQGMESFISEVQIMSKLQKGPFINLFEVFEGDHTYYLVMDLMQGRTLAEELEILKSRKELFPIKTVKLIMKQILQGLVMLHESRIIHRDLKPDNIMFKTMDSYDELKIVDFGLATFMDVQKYSFPKCGTPGYVAPEILNLVDRDYKYDSVCDIFSCGCIFYKLLVGSSLFPGNTFNEVLKLNKNCSINLDIPDLNNCSKDAVDLLQKMLERNPYDRISAKKALFQPFFLQENSPVIKKPTKETNSHGLKIKSKNIFRPTDQADSIDAQSPFQRVQAVKQVEEDDLTENKNEAIFIRQMPSVKKPTFVPHHEDSNSINSFYAKDPLSSFKKHRRDSENIDMSKQSELTNDKQNLNNNGQPFMQRISLFNIQRQQE
ncbi:hypothetical protein pb186bvf_012458 [Paramecium bursaria]